MQTGRINNSFLKVRMSHFVDGERDSVHDGTKQRETTSVQNKWMKETSIRSGNQQIDALVPRIKSFLSHDTADYNMMGTQLRGYRSPDAPSIWLRDHSDI